MEMRNNGVIRVGSRKSELALIQTKYVIGRLQNIYPQNTFEIHTMSTMGDRVLNISLPKIGEKSLFTRDLEDALRCGGVDFVVHSLKDLPTVLPDGMVIGAVLEREDERDALVLRTDLANYKIETLPAGSVLGTSSLRRTAQIRKTFPDLIVNDIRGNLNTRLSKLDAPDSRFAGIILAKAGLDRMKWTERISQVLEPTEVLYAVGQGALAVECRENDNETLNMLKHLCCLETTYRVLAERSFLKTLGGGCSAPVAVCSQLMKNKNVSDKSRLHLVGGVWSLDGATQLREERSCFIQISSNKRSNLDGELTCSKNQDNPPLKRNKTSDAVVTEQNSPFINDTDEIIKKDHEIETLLKKHIGLARKCPFVAGENVENNLNNNLRRGGGDADVLDNRCPLHLGIGVDVMGKCPFLNTALEANQCPNQNSLELPEATMPSTSSSSETTLAENHANSSQLKCPFLRKNIEIFDYKQDENLVFEISGCTSAKDNFCGIFKHDSFNNEIFVKCNEFGKELAQVLIANGALDIMRTAQAEIHNNM